MKHRKKVLLLIAVAIIVLGVSSTFAYFTIKPLISGEGARTDISTARVEDTILSLEGSVGFDDREIYPGHQNISKLKLTATGENKAVYNLEWNGTNTLNTSIEYKVYKTTSETNASITCNKIKDTVNGLMYHYEECTSNNVDSLGEVVASGVIPSKLSSSGIRLIKNEEIQATKSGEIVYYYVVLEFPNKDGEQNYDINGTVNGKVTIEIVNEDIICKTYNVNTALGEIAVNDCTPETYAKINFTEEYKEELRNLGLDPDSNFKVIGYAEGKNIRVRGTNKDIYTTSYQGTDLIDNAGFFVDGSILDHYVGKGEWNAEYEECYFNGDTVYSIATDDSTFTEEECNNMNIYDGAVQRETYVGGELRKVGTIEYISQDGIYAAEDDEGTSYHYYGNKVNNFVKFGKYPDNTPDAYVGYYSETSTSYKEYSSLSACQSATSYNYNCTKIKGAGEDMYWRIIRINGDGSIRLIYNGISTDQTGAGTQIGTSSFNTSYNDNAYVGYMYGKTGASTYQDTHANTNSSTIKTYIDNWYVINLLSYDNYINKNAGFCGDRSVNTTDESWNIWGWKDTKLGYNKNTTLYGSLNRVYNTKIPTYKCLNKNIDLYTIADSTRGNKALTYPIGLITVDEVMYSGATVDNGSWLTTGNWYLTLSPSFFQSGNAFVQSMSSVGVIDYYSVNNIFGVRPVINLNSDVNLTGSGTINDPYMIEGTD